MSHADLAKYFKTEKHFTFSTDFFTNAENYEVWDEIDFSDLTEVDGENTFEIEAEDLKFYAEGGLDDNPLMTDEDYAQKSAYGGLVSHPIFLISICFWCIGVKGKGNWIRTPGARTPGQVIEVYESFKVGEVIHIKMKPHDRYIKRGKYYLQYQLDAYNQDNVLKSRMYVSLILPRTREDIRKFLKGIRGLED
jgi:acyl dehydratase